MAASAPNASPATLALETSTRAPSLALRVGEGPVTGVELDGDSAHASDLAPAVQALLASRDSAPDRIVRIVVGTGPGSLTGLRVGAATAIGLARAVGAELLGVPSLAACALGARQAGARGALACVHDLRGGHVAIAQFEASDDPRSPLGLPQGVGGSAAIRAVPYGDLPRALTELDACALVADAGLLERLGARDRDRERALAPVAPTAAALLQLEALGAPSVQPLYLRAFGS